MSDVGDVPSTASDATPVDVGVDQHPAPAKQIPSSRIGRARITGAFGLAILVIVLVFVLENRSDVKVEFFGATWRLPLAVDLLLAAVLGAVVTLLLGTARIIQLRRLVRRQAGSSILAVASPPFLTSFPAPASVIGRRRVAPLALALEFDPVSEVEMAWLLRGGDVLASIDRTTDSVTRIRATARLATSNHVLWCERTRVAHSVGSRCPLDAAYIDKELVVVALTSLAPLRIGRPRPAVTAVIEAPAGSFARWNLQLGDHLELRE